MSISQPTAAPLGDVYDTDRKKKKSVTRNKNSDESDSWGSFQKAGSAKSPS